ncbi:MAG TPA: ParB/RepB/Spo0J family partition protein [Terriglobales bacterium]|nr:ParB/RepB/Spo0J family partition protein [Terriglobales bacterium]
MQNQNKQNGEYRNLAIEQLEESPTNPRKRFNQASLMELAESFKSQGVLQPLVVRTKNEDAKKYEVVAGARRLRAAQLAELKAVPVRVVELSDSDAVLAQVTENLQREDIHPLEEAFGFRSLLSLNDPNYTVPTLAAKAGKSEAYVQGRIKLTELIAPIADAFLADKITIGHALLIAKLPAGQQQQAFNACFRQIWTNEGNTPTLIPVRELASWIESNILLELAAASFSKSDETLMPEAGSCTNCPKRTGFNALLFADVRKDSCTDPQCFRAKLDAHVSKTLQKKPELVQISSAWNSREGAPLGRNRYLELDLKRAKLANQATKANPAQRTCEKMADAIVMDGGRRGQTVKVCADPACRIHHGNHPSRQEVARQRAEERRRMEKEKLAITVRHRILAATLQRVSPPLKKSDLLLVAQYLISRLQFAEVAQIAKRHKVEVDATNGVPEQILLKHVSRLDDIELSRLLIELSLISLASRVPSKQETDVLLTTAKHYRIEIEKLEKEVAQKFADKQKKETKAKKAVA